MDEAFKIGDAAAALGVAPHVLRHWEDMGILRPDRLPSGHRIYSEQLIGEARMIQICQRAGLSLNEIAELRAGNRARREQHIRRRRERIREQIADLGRADRFLDHVLTCRHPVVSECPECTELTRTPLGRAH